MFQVAVPLISRVVGSAAAKAVGNKAVQSGFNAGAARVAANVAGNVASSATNSALSNAQNKRRA